MPKFFRKKEKQLQRLQRRSKAKKDTKQYQKILKDLEKCHYRVKSQRNDFLHKKTNELLKNQTQSFMKNWQ
jgi:putative transposase